jgi:hypothetical protein
MHQISGITMQTVFLLLVFMANIKLGMQDDSERDVKVASRL